MDEQHYYRFGEFLVEPTQNQISIQGEVRAVEPRAMDVLVYLIQNRNRVVSADELLGNLWPGRVAEESTIHRRISQLRNVLDDSSKQSRYIKTVVKRGYQAVAEVSVPEDSKSTQALTATVSPSNQRQLLFLSAVVLSLILLVGLAYFLPQDDPELFDEIRNSDPSIAVLPFTNMSEFPENEYFAAGVHEDLLTSLSGIAELAVISRTSVMRYADHEESVKQIGEELNVDYVVEGSVRRQHQQVRISVQLIDAQNDRHMWAMSYDRELADTFAVQSEITKEVAAQLSIEILDKEVAKYDPEVIDLLFEARELMRAKSTESLAMALDILYLARSRGPENAEVHSAIAKILFMQSQENRSWEDVRFEFRDSVNMALQLEPELASAHIARGRALIYWWQILPRAEETYLRVLNSTPNNAEALLRYGELLGNAKMEGDLAIPYLRRAVALNPYSGEAWSSLSAGLMRAGYLDESYQTLRDGFARIPEDPFLLQTQMEYFRYRGATVQAMHYLVDQIKRDPGSLRGISLMTGDLTRLGFYTEAQLWLDEMFRISPEHIYTYNSEVQLLRYQHDWSGLVELNTRWEPILPDHVAAPRRNWRLWLMQDEADSLWREDKNIEAQHVYKDISTILTEDIEITDLMGNIYYFAPELLRLGNLLAHSWSRTDRVDEAEELLVKITNNEGIGSGFEINRAVAQAMLGKTDEAIEAFEKSITDPVPDQYGIQLFMDQDTDWLNGINRDPETVGLYQDYLADLAEVKSRVRAELPQVLNPATLLASSRTQ